jgi:hypothetical protein
MRADMRKADRRGGRLRRPNPSGAGMGFAHALPCLAAVLEARRREEGRKEEQ